MGARRIVVKGGKAADALACKSVVDEVLAPEKDCGAHAQGDCSFNGVWDGSRGAGAVPFYLSSYLFDQSGWSCRPRKTKRRYHTKKILAAAKKACSLSPEQVLQEFKGVERKITVLLS